ncbi:3-phenylpropionate/trans-cinnamate dioxygenase ferredoxin reductase subunit [Novosphingobium sp. 1529]|uniref:NAD(P)/FAD-dependent oxidoreductase n=1 Tax=Novosphingobium sp. 1529 TaxID=3156424 RepID=UPI003396E28B
MSAGPVVVIGAGQAGYGVARALRAAAYRGAIALIGDEPHPPYERPPLSKAVMLGLEPESSTYMTSAEGLAAQQIDWITDRVVEVNRQGHTVVCEDGRRLPYDRLVFATGGRPRRLAVPGADLAGVHCLRSIADVQAIRGGLAPDCRMVVVGGGWIGLEVAASARTLGVRVTVVEALPKLCARSLPDPAAEFLLSLHRQNGVDVVLDRGVRGFAGQDWVEAVELDDGTVLPADLVIVGVGMVPNAELARVAGLDVASGIIVDENGRTSDSAIFAAGDVAETRRNGRLVRAESWANANEQAAQVAAALTGQPLPARAPAWFWSDQYDSNIQMLGAIPAQGGEPVVLRDAAGEGRSWIYLAEDRLAAVIAVNRPRDIQAGKRIMMRTIAVTADAIAAAGDLSQVLRLAAN